MFTTFFCKRDKHKECPGNWPVNETCGPDEDCSFDMKMIECECSCHATSTNSTISTSTAKTKSRSTTAKTSITTTDHNT